MRILLALDGSHGAATAHALVQSLPWPDPSHIDAFRVIEPVFDMFGMSPIGFDDTLDDLLGTADVRRALDADTIDLGAPGRTIATHVEIGRPATLIVEAATRLRSDLIVLGSRGRGPISTMVLGSVSAEVADHAPCPVLVARRPTCDRAMVALDGTPFTEHIVEAVQAFTFLRDTHLDVVSIAPSVAPGPGIMLSSGGYGVPFTWFEEGVDAATASLEHVASAAAAALTERGREASWAVHHGDPAATLIEVAQRSGTDLIIVGTHGRTGMTRLLLGSVARNVLLHAHASVLVLREAHGSGHAAEAHTTVATSR